MSSHCPLHGYQASCITVFLTCCFVTDNSWERLQATLRTVGIPQHLSVPLITNTVFASLSLSCMCAGVNGVYACMWWTCVMKRQPRPHPPVSPLLPLPTMYSLP